MQKFHKKYIIKPTKNIYRFCRNYYKDYRNSFPYQVKVFNAQWRSSYVPDHWLYQFIVSRGLLQNTKKNISIFSVNGQRAAIKINQSKIKIFYTCENVHVPYSFWKKYEDLMLNNKDIQLSLGFDYIAHDQYLRFPEWILWIFKPNESFQSIKEKCKSLNNHRIDTTRRNQFCSFICRMDYFGDRLKMLNYINQIEKVNCPGLFMHNDNSLHTLYDNNKIIYLENFKFNLCPENTNANGYVTEKIFEAITSGCIPIYWGADNNPEPDLINQEAIIFLNPPLNGNVLETISELNNNEKLYRKFAEQNRLKVNAHEKIYFFYEQLENKIKEILKNF